MKPADKVVMPDLAAVPSSKPVVSLIAAGLIGASIGALGGATITSPPAQRSADVELYVHHLRLERGTPEAAAVVTAYATTTKHLADGGTRTKDQGGVRCAASGPYTGKLLAGLDGVCAAGGWLHVVELSLASDGGTQVGAWASHLGDDGGRVDDGQQKCEAPAQDVADVVFQEALSCAEAVLED